VAAQADPRVTNVVTRVSGAAMLATAANSYGAFFIAIDPAVEDQTTLALSGSIVQGEMFEDADAKGMVIGKVLAENLDTKIGRKVVYTVTDKNGEIVSGLARVSGIVETGADTIDGGLCLLPIGAVRQLLGYQPHEGTHVAVFLGDHRDSDDVARALDAAAEAAGGKSLTWAEASPDLAGFISLKVGSTIVMEFIIMLLLAAGIFNTLFVSVMERLREFGIMTALGFTARQIFGLVMWESTWLALVGLVGAVAVTAYPYYYMSEIGIDLSQMYAGNAEVSGVAMDPILYSQIYPEHALVIAVVVVLATLASGLYPAWKAGRTSPSDAIRLS
jgi:ABC-type lipoprotein release transport system permease subunit